MVSDAEARNAVLHLMKRFDLIQAQHLGLAYVLAKRDSEEYERSAGGRRQSHYGGDSASC